MTYITTGLGAAAPFIVLCAAMVSWYVSAIIRDRLTGRVRPSLRWRYHRTRYVLRRLVRARVRKPPRRAIRYTPSRRPQYAPGVRTR